MRSDQAAPQEGGVVQEKRLDKVSPSRFDLLHEYEPNPANSGFFFGLLTTYPINLSIKLFVVAILDIYLCVFVSYYTIISQLIC